MQTLSLNTKLRIEQSLSNLFDRATYIKKVEQLANRTSTTYRIHISNGHEGNATLILKCLNLTNRNRLQKKFAQLDFIKEVTTYEFLSQINPKFPYVPQLLASQIGTPSFLILEDLGANTHASPLELERVQMEIGECLAKFHITCQPHIDDFIRLFQQRKQKINIEERQLVDLGRGITVIKDFFKFKSLELSPTFFAGLEAIKRLMEHRSPFFTLTHYDLVRKRQTVRKNNQFYLIDFEKVVTGNALLDVARLLVDKVEFIGKNRRFHLFSSGFSTTFVESHRYHFEKESPTGIDAHLWEESLSAALVYTTIMEIGRIKKFMDKECLFLCAPIDYYLKLINDLDKYMSQYGAFGFMVAELLRLGTNKYKKLATTSL